MFDCAVVAQPIVAKHSNQHYTKPADANERITGTVFPYVLWYDNSKWRIEARDSKLFENIRKGVERRGQTLDHLFVDKKGELFISVAAESNVPRSYETILENLSEGAARNNLNIVTYEYRKVNNADILYVEYTKKTKKTELTLASYYYSNPDGLVIIVGTTTSEIFNKRKEDLFSLLNGIERGKS